jgi:adenine-specific DNA-methyltransferase
MLEKFAALKTQNSDLAQLQREWRSAIKEQVAAHAASLEQDGEPTTDLGPTLPKYKYVDERGAYTSNRDVHGSEKGQYFYDVRHPVTGKVCKRPPSGYRFPQDTMNQLLSDDRIVFGKDEKQQIQIKKYLQEVNLPLRSLQEVNSARGSNTLKALFPDGAQRFAHPKPVELIQQLLDFAGDADALILDPFAGSGTVHPHRRGDARRPLLSDADGSETT